MTHETDSTTKNFQDYDAKLAELNRLAALIFEGQQPVGASDVDYLAFEMELAEFWLRLFGADSMDAVAAVLQRCNSKWRAIEQEPITYLDRDFGLRESIPFLGKTEGGTVMPVKIDFCDQDNCDQCPTWASRGHFARIPKTGSNRLIGWLGLDDILALEGHTFAKLPMRPQHVEISIGNERYSEKEMHTFLHLHHKLEHGSDDEKQALKALILAHQNGSVSLGK